MRDAIIRGVSDSDILTYYQTGELNKMLYGSSTIVPRGAPILQLLLEMICVARKLKYTQEGQLLN